MDRRNAVAHEHQPPGERPARLDGSRKMAPRNGIGGTKVREYVMAGVATVTVALFLTGVVTGVIVVVALAIRREDRRYSLVREAPDRMSRSARLVNRRGPARPGR